MLAKSEFVLWGWNGDETVITKAGLEAPEEEEQEYEEEEDTYCWSQFSDSNRGPTVYKTVALPLS